ncbi:hypothetical protein Lal_00012641 [Lupinus albus]|nr:hypothetical protein Lal_00012641 [Lupinus albus]
MQGPKPSTTTSGQQPSMCNKCGRAHFGDICPEAGNRCFFCKEPVHVKRFCPKLNRNVNLSNTERPMTNGRVFTMNGSRAIDVEGLIKGSCVVKGISLCVLLDSGATHSFISCECVKRLSLKVDVLPFDLMVSTHTNAPVVVSTFCHKCPMVVYDRTFLIDLICLPLSQIDVILGMDWLSEHRVLLNCFDKTVMFGIPSEMSDTPNGPNLLSAHEVETPLKEGALVYVLLASLEGEKKSGMKDTRHNNSSLPLRVGHNNSPLPLRVGHDNSPLPLWVGHNNSPLPLRVGHDNNPLPFRIGHDNSPLPLRSSRRVLAQASPFSLRRENPAFLKFQIRPSRSSEGFSLRRESHSPNRFPLAQARDSRSGENLTVPTDFLSLKRPIPRLGETLKIFSFRNTNPLAWARSSRSSESLAECPIPQDCYIISKRINLGCYNANLS